MRKKIQEFNPYAAQVGSACVMYEKPPQENRWDFYFWSFQLPPRLFSELIPGLPLWSKTKSEWLSFQNLNEEKKYVYRTGISYVEIFITFKVKKSEFQAWTSDFHFISGKTSEL